MKEFSLPTAQMYELANVVDTIPLSDLQTTKDIRLTTNLVKDLREVCGEYSTKKTDFDTLTATIALPYKARYAEEGKDLSEEEGKALVKKLDAELIAEVTKTHADKMTELESIAKAEVKAELGDEKFAKLKELFEKYGAKYYVVKSVFIQIADALGVE